MKITGLVPMLRTHDVDVTVNFYRDLLGFECASRMEGWAALQKDAVEIMVAAPNAHEPFDKPSFTGSLYFRADDVDALWQQVKDKAKIVYPIEDFDYGMREFAILDNNGYLLQFGMPLEAEA
jgi:uncharacterized glyoxalase superfamily protein PhnB